MSYAYHSSVGLICDGCYRCGEACIGVECERPEHDDAMATPDYRDPIPHCALCGRLLNKTFHARDPDKREDS